MAYDMLEGIKVVELSMYAFAPASAAILGDWGADVIKVVPPMIPDTLMGRAVGGLPDSGVGVAFMWEIMNRGKRCLGADVSTEEGREVLLDLVRQADVFITNLLPARRRRFRLDPEDLFAINPGLVYGRASGHGDRGPERESGGYDHTDFWARSGIAHAASMVTGEFIPQAGPALGDLSSAAFLAGAIAAALLRKARTGRGAVVDVSLFSSGLWVASPGVVASQLYGVDNIPRLGHADLPNPLVAAYATRDHRLIYLSGIHTEGHFANLCVVLGRKNLLDDPRFATGAARQAHTRECIAALDEAFAQHDLAFWVEALKNLSMPWTIVQSAAEAASDPQTTANQYVTLVEGGQGRYPLVASPAQFDSEPTTLTPAPDHGQHTEEILLELGRDWDEIIRLKEKGAVL
jgi:crotonobetainyl-CoA:carnitine CoA-transferase CaiB-like acyl-CoA transferase